MLTAPRLAGWAVSTTDLGRAVASARSHGVPLGPVISGSRARPDGVRLAWQCTDPTTVVADGIVPFLIDWGSSPHPSATAAGGVELVQLGAEHPNAPEVQRLLSVLGVHLRVERGPVARLIATLRTVQTEIELS